MIKVKKDQNEAINLTDGDLGLISVPKIRIKIKIKIILQFKTLQHRTILLTIFYYTFSKIVFFSIRFCAVISE